MTQIVETLLGNFSLKNSKDPSQVFKYNIKNELLSVDILSYGSTISSILLPDRNGLKQDVVLGYDDVTNFINKNGPYFGSTIGRVANRISNGSFYYEGIKYDLSKNWNGILTLHGGETGFDKRNWCSEINGDTLKMTLVSEDGDQGFPGELKTTITYKLEDNKLIINFFCTTLKATPVNLTNHSYFNLAGHGAGSKGLFDHEVTIFSNKFTPLDPKSLTPTGEISSVSGTPYDLTKAQNLGHSILKTEDGFDINYCFDDLKIKKIALVYHKPSGRSLTVHSNQPGVQFYTANFLDNELGKNGTLYQKHGAFCLETQILPNSVNIPKFSNSILLPGMNYSHDLIYEFNCL